MTLSQWLVTPDGIPVLVALVGILSGVIGGGVSQLIAGFFKTRGDTRQIKAATEVAKAAELRWEREQEFERKKLSYDRLRDVSVRLIQAHSMQYSSYCSLHFDDGEFDAAELRGAQSDRYAAEAELSLMVPASKPAIDEANRTLSNLDETEQGEPTPDKQWWRYYDKYIEARGNLEDVIRGALALDATLIHNQPQIGETNPSGTPKPINP